MTAAEEMEAVLSETVAALAHMRMEELAELERRAARIAASLGSDGLQATRGLRAKVGLLESCLGATAENLSVLERLRSRKAMV